LRPYSWVALLFSGAITAVVLAACGGGSTTSPVTNFTPQSVALSTSAPLSATALAQQPVATSIPAPAGYSQSVSAALVTAPANTSVTIKEGNSNPSGVPALGFASNSGRAQSMGKVRPMVSGTTNAVYYDVISPSASITVAGTVSFTQAFPSGTLTSGTSYYLAFYDSTQASPSWQTISGPVTSSDGLSLTFSGTVSSFTLQQGQAYGFCVFSVSGSSTPPPSTNQEEAYLAQYTSGILVYNTAGTLQQTININSSGMGLDDSANIYNVYIPPTPSPSGSQPPAVIQKFPAGSTTANATFAGTAATNPNATSTEGFISTSGSGELVDGYYAQNTDGLGNFNVSLDVWNAGSTGGAPNYTLTADQADNFTYDVQHDGTIYLSQNQNAVPSYLVFAPGSSTPTRTITETYVTGSSNLANFSPNYMTVGPDGTLYVTEYTFVQPDPECGLYIYPPSGSEKFVALDSNSNGCGAYGVDVDAVGNIYVAINNSGYDSNNGYATLNDTENEIEVFAPGGASVLRRISVQNPISLVVAPDGTVFVSSFLFPGSTGLTATSVVAPGATTATQITSQAETAIVLYNGYQESAASLRRHTSVSAAANAMRGGATSFAKFYKLTHRGRSF
jgi:hypothetical protein